MAHKKAAGSAKNLRDSKPKYRGVKVFGGQNVLAGNIIVRQKGNKYEAGKNTYFGRDFSIHASIDGVVNFSKSNKTKFDGRKYIKTFVNVVSAFTDKPVTKKPTNLIAKKNEKQVEKIVEKKIEKKVEKKTTTTKKDIENKTTNVVAKKPVVKKTTVSKKTDK